MAERRRALLPYVALLGLAFAAWSVFSQPRNTPPAPAVPPPKAPYPHTLAGAGVLEPAGGRTTGIGVPFASLVLEVKVEVGALVEAGQVLLRLDDRALLAAAGPLTAAVRAAEASLAVAEAEVAAHRAEVPAAVAAADAARARRDAVKDAPRPESLPPLKARVAEAESAVDDLAAQVARLEEVRQASPGTVPVDEWDRRRYALGAARSTRDRARADLALAEAGAWAPDLAAAEAAVREAQGRVAAAEAAVTAAESEARRRESEVARARAAIDENTVLRERTLVRAPLARPCSTWPCARASTRAGRDALLVLGDVRTLWVRVDVDEESAPLVPRTAVPRPWCAASPASRSSSSSCASSPT